MGKPGTISVVLAMLTIAQKVGNYENRPLALILAIGASVALLCWSIQAYFDGRERLRCARAAGDRRTCWKIQLSHVGYVALGIGVIAAIAWQSGTNNQPVVANEQTAGTSAPHAKPDREAQPAEPERQTQPTVSKSANTARVTPSRSAPTVTTGSVTIQTGGVASFGQTGGVTAGQYIVNQDPSQEPPRRIPRDKWTPLKEVLGKWPGRVSVSAVQGNNEAHRFAQDWYDLLKESGWTMLDEKVRVFISVGPLDPGILFRMHGAQLTVPNEAFQVPTESPAGAVSTAFILAGFHSQVRGLRFMDMAENQLTIEVAPKPRD